MNKQFTAPKLLLLIASGVITNIVLSYYKAFAFTKIWNMLASPYGWELGFSTEQVFVILLLVQFVIEAKPKEEEEPDIVKYFVVAALTKMFTITSSIFIAWLVSVLIF